MAPTDLPIACTLPPADLAARKDDLAAFAAQALRSREPLPGGARLRFSGDEETAQRLRAIVAAESDCCAFLSFDLKAEDGLLRLDVTGPADAQPIIAELFA